MHVPLLKPVSSSHFCISGDVTIHPTAVIAAGVLLQADPESRILIGAGVCLGMGTVLHAHQGPLEVEAEVTIGAGVLIIGTGTIGASACIGAASTLWNHSIERGAIVPPLSLLGTPDHQMAAPVSMPASEPVSTSIAKVQDSPNGAIASPSSVQEPNSAIEPTGKPAAEIQLSFTTPVYGQANLNRLLSTLLPHRQALPKGEA